MTKFNIELHDRMMACDAEPIEGRWYVGVNSQGQTGAVAQYVGGEFVNSCGVVNMAHYEYLRACPAAKAVPTSTPESDPIQDPTHVVNLALRWLETLINSPAVTWDPDQKASAEEALAKAKAAI